MKEKFSLVVPTYNEAKNIEKICLSLIKNLSENNINFEIIIVDDDSPDGTWQLAEELAKIERSLRVIRRTGQRDLSRAVIMGWQNALGSILGVIDADFQHPPEVLPIMVKKLMQKDGVDIAIASRYAKGGGISVWSISRKIISRLGTLISNFFLPGILTRVNDPMSGFFVLRKEVIENKILTPKGYKIILEVLAKGSYKNVIEVPFIFKEREAGGSKLSLKQYIKFLNHICRLSFETKEIFRVIKYILVGFTGALVTVGIYLLGLKLNFGPFFSYCFALTLATINNFLLNEYWTFRDISICNSGLKLKIYRFIKFNLICFSGALLSLSVFLFFTKIMGFGALYAVLGGILAAFIWNFLGSANIAWFFKLYHKLPAEDLLEEGYYHSVLKRNIIQRFWHLKKFETIFKKLDSLPVVDIGSGPGVFFHLYRSYPGLKVNLDYSYNQLKYARNLNKEAACIVGTSDVLPFKDESIGNVCLIEVIEHLEGQKIKHCLLEAFRVLKKGGKAIVSTPNYKSPWLLLEPIVSFLGPVDYQMQHLTHFDMVKLIKYLEVAGFKIKSKETLFILSPFTAIFGPKLASFFFNLETIIFPFHGSILLVEAVKN
ncbi:MAG: glycosyltransferase [Candidatus Omnitrophota bacterium]